MTIINAVPTCRQLEWLILLPFGREPYNAQMGFVGRADTYVPRVKIHTPDPSARLCVGRSMRVRLIVVCSCEKYVFTPPTSDPVHRLSRLGRILGIIHTCTFGRQFGKNWIKFINYVRRYWLFGLNYRRVFQLRSCSIKLALLVR